MAKDNYTLRDYEYFKLLQLIAEELEDEEIDYALVGGGAVQSRIADIFNRRDGLTAPNLSEFLLRKTKDFDITSRSSESDFIIFLNVLQAKNKRLSVGNKQPRRVNLIYQGRRSQRAVSINLNYQLGSQDFSGLNESFYNQCIDTAEALYLNYNHEEVLVRVATPECIVASKLTRSSAKDIVDISMLLNVLASDKGSEMKYFDYSLVKRYLRGAGKGHCYENLVAIVTEVLKE